MIYGLVMICWRTQGEAYDVDSVIRVWSFLCRAVNMDAWGVWLPGPMTLCNGWTLLPTVIPFEHNPAWTTKATASCGGSSESRTFQDPDSSSKDPTATPAKAAALVGCAFGFLSLLGHSHFQCPFCPHSLHVLSAILWARDGRRWKLLPLNPFFDLPLPLEVFEFPQKPLDLALIKRRLRAST